MRRTLLSLVACVCVCVCLCVRETQLINDKRVETITIHLFHNFVAYTYLYLMT